MPPISRLGLVRQLLRAGGHRAPAAARPTVHTAFKTTTACYSSIQPPVSKAERQSNSLRSILTKPGAVKRFGKLVTVTQPADQALLELKYENMRKAIPVSKFWLRDSCQSAHSVSPSSGQKRFRTTDLPETPEVANASVDEAGTLTIEWANEVTDSGEPHVSTYACEPLLLRLGRLSTPSTPPMPGRRLWDRARLERELRPVQFSDWATGDNKNAEFVRGLLDLHQTGILIVDGVPESNEGVLKVANAIGNVQTTFYGETFDVVSKPEAENVAYTNVFLCLHQDLMYMREPPYIQLLHCLQNECDGGESLFSDGARAGYEIMDKSWTDFLTLSKRHVPYHYERHGHYYYHSRPVIDSMAGYIWSTAWAPPFQNSFGAPEIDMTLAHPVQSGPVVTNDLDQWRRAAKKFSDLIEAPENQFEVKMKPGQCVLFNNMRVLHGRNQFNTSQGSRHLRGTYIDQQTFYSKLMSMVVDTNYDANDGHLSWSNSQKGLLEQAQVKEMLEAAESRKAAE